MKKTLVIVGLISILLLPAMLLACAGNINASLGQEFTLPAGKTVEIKGESLSIKFIQVITDSRCPTGVECVWAGEATCRMEINLNGVASERILTISGGTSDKTQETVDQYTFSFKLEPYPQAGKDIVPTDYYLLMTVTK